MSPSTAATHDIFLCHASEDKAQVRELASDLGKLGVRAWYDAWELGPGDSLIQKIGTAITATNDFGVVVSRHSVASAWCARELEEALNLELTSSTRKVIPIRLEKVTMPPFLSGKVYVDLSKPDGLVHLASAVRRIPPKEVDAFLASGVAIFGLSRPEVAEAVARFIVETTDKAAFKNLGSRDWAELQRLLSRHGIDIGDEIEIRDLRTGRTQGAA